MCQRVPRVNRILFPQLLKPKKIKTHETPKAKKEDSSATSKPADELRDEPISKPEETPTIEDTLDSNDDEIDSSDGMEGSKVVRAAKNGKKREIYFLNEKVIIIFLR